MTISEHDKELAAHVRSTNVFEAVFPAEYSAYCEKVQCEKLLIPTRAGDSLVYVTRPKHAAPGRLVHIYLHGGGFCREHGKRDDYFCAKIADITGGIVFDLDYRLAPEYKFPVALRETYDVTKWIFEHLEEFKGDPENITMSGYSAGGNLICAANLLACDSKEFRVRRQILCYPALDLFTDPADKPRVPDNYPTIPDERSRIFNELYIGGKEIGASPYASPLLASDRLLGMLPETLLIVGGMDPFQFDAQIFTNRISTVGGKSTLRRFEHSRHGFIINCMDEWEEAQRLVIDNILK